MWNIRVIVLILAVLINEITASVHSYGTRFTDSTRGLAKELYRSYSTIPRNYTIVYRYIGTRPGPMIHYADIVVENNPSQGELIVNTYNRTIEATITITNGTNVVVTFTLDTFGADFFDTPDAYRLYNAPLPGISARPPQSFTVVHIQDPGKSNGTRFKHNAVGHRQPNDKLIHFRSQNVTNLSNFASKLFEYTGGDDVAISYVGFSFDSPTAVVYLNSTFIGVNQFSAIVYDLSAPELVANMSIFGYDRGEKPANFVPVVRV